MLRSSEEKLVKARTFPLVSKCYWLNALRERLIKERESWNVLFYFVCAFRYCFEVFRHQHLPAK